MSRPLRSQIRDVFASYADRLSPSAAHVKYPRPVEHARAGRDGTRPRVPQVRVHLQPASGACRSVRVFRKGPENGVRGGRAPQFPASSDSLPRITDGLPSLADGLKGIINGLESSSDGLTIITFRLESYTDGLECNYFRLTSNTDGLDITNHGLVITNYGLTSSTDGLVCITGHFPTSADAVGGTFQPVGHRGKAAGKSG